MKHSFIFVLIIALWAFNAKAQSVLDGSVINAGIGISSWGIPVYVGVDVPIKENITVGANISYQSDKETYYDVSWKHTIIGVSTRADYQLGELIELPEDFELYAGVSLGYWVWNTKVDAGRSSMSYNGNANGGIGFRGQAGARYFVSNNLALNIEVGGGNILSGGRFGISMRL